MAVDAQGSTADTLPRYIQVSSALEFSRLVCALEYTPRISFLHDHGGQKILSAQVDVLKEKPIFYYTPLEPDGHYLSYVVRGGREELDIVDSVSDASRAYSPIVRIKSLPHTMRPGSGTPDRYDPLELEDLPSLTRLKAGIDENPFPLFLFPHGGRWLLGIFMNFSEDGPSYFCHVSLDADPGMPFLKFSLSGGSGPEFVENPSEHGYSYSKIIKLKGAHPLVDYGRL